MIFWQTALTTVVTVLISLAITLLWNRIIAKPGKIKAEREEHERRVQVLMGGLQAILRSRLISLYEESMHKGYAPRTVKEDFENMYKSYHALGANGYMDEMREQFLALPSERPKNKTILKG